jgi:hypothetical protein
VATNAQRLVIAERLLAIAIWSAAASGIVWILKQPIRPDHHYTVGPLNSPRFVLGIVLWIPTLGWPLFLLLAAAAHLPFLITRWVNRWNNGNPAFRLGDRPGYAPKGRYISMEVDPREPMRRETILLGTQLICGSTAVGAVISVVVLLALGLILRRMSALAGACAIGVVLGREIYPRRGIRYRTGLVDRESLVRRLCLDALSRAAQGPVPIQDWRAEYFAIIRTPSDGSTEEFYAASWVYTYALLNGDLETATRYVERNLALLPEDAPLTQYIALGDAVHLYAVVALDEGKSKSLAQRINSIGGGLFRRQEYIEAAIALAEGRRTEALSIARARLDRIGPKGGTAWTQLERNLLIRFTPASPDPDGLP